MFFKYCSDLNEIKKIVWFFFPLCDRKMYSWISHTQAKIYVCHHSIISLQTCWQPWLKLSQMMQAYDKQLQSDTVPMLTKYQMTTKTVDLRFRHLCDALIWEQPAVQFSSRLSFSARLTNHCTTQNQDSKYLNKVCTQYKLNFHISTSANQYDAEQMIHKTQVS